MKHALHKSQIPETKTFVIKYLNDPCFDPNWHFHSEYQLFVVLEGSGTRFIGDNISHFQEGDMVFTGPNLPHLWRNDDIYYEKATNLRVQGIVVYFPENFLGERALIKEEMLPVKHLLENAARGMQITGPTAARVTAMMQDLLHLKGIESIIQLLSILQVLADSAELDFIASLGYINTSKETDKDKMSGVYNYIVQNFKSNITLEEVAAIANMSPTTFSRYFKARTNKPFSAFVAELRIGLACKLLMDEEDSISQIAYKCGFNTLSNFNKQFKDLRHKTPYEYRKEYAYLN